jgi:hypothetical protein
MLDCHHRTSSALGSCFFGSRLVPDPVPSALLPWLRGSNLPRGLLLKPAPLLLVMGRACRPTRMYVCQRLHPQLAMPTDELHHKEVSGVLDRVACMHVSLVEC